MSRKKILLSIPVILLALSLGAVSLVDRLMDAKYTGPTMTLSDGTELVTFVHLPEGDGPFPTLIFRTVYELPMIPLGGMTHIDYSGVKDKYLGQVGWPEITEAGYALIVQHSRGRIGSEGQAFDMTDRQDGVELIEWIQSQSWSNGRVGTLGDSAGANLSVLMNAENPQGLDASFIQAGSPNLLNESVFGPGGALKLELFLPWIAEQAATADDQHYETIGLKGFKGLKTRIESLLVTSKLLSSLDEASDSEIWRFTPLMDFPALPKSIPTWERLLNTGPHSDDFAYYDTASSNVPTFHASLWYDVFATSQLNAFERGELSGQDQRLIILNGTHYTSDQPGSWPVNPLLPWFDAKLKDDMSALEGLPRVIFPISNEKDDWYSSDTWPPRAVNIQTWNLSADGHLFPQDIVLDTDLGTETVNVDTAEDNMSSAILTYSYDPNDPVPTIGGRNLLISDGPLDQTTVRIPYRNDVLSYTSDVLTDELNVIGHIYGGLTISSDRPDTDFTMKLLDITPQGEAILVADGIIRMRYRDGTAQQSFLKPSETYEVEIDLGHMAWRFKPGHRLAVDVSSSNFPQWDRNHNTDEPLYMSENMTIAQNSVHHGPATSTLIRLPIVNDMSELTAHKSYVTKVDYTTEPTED